MHGRTISRQRAQVHNRDRTPRWTDNIPGDGLHHRRQPRSALGRWHRCGSARLRHLPGRRHHDHLHGHLRKPPARLRVGSGHQRHDRGHRHHHVRRRLARGHERYLPRGYRHLAARPLRPARGHHGRHPRGPAPRHLGGSGPVYRHDRPVRRRHHHRWRRYARRPGRHRLPPPLSSASSPSS